MKVNFDDWQNEILNATGNIVLCSGRQVGKSTIIAKRDAEFAVHNKNKSVLIISATERQAEELFIKVLNYLTDNYKTYIKKGKDRPTRHIIKLNNGSIIRCLPTGLAGVGIRGFTIDRLTADEAAFIPEEVWQAVTPMLLTTGGDIVLLSTPHGKQGYFYQCYQSKDFKVFHINSEKVISERPISETWTLHQRTKALEHLEREKLAMPKLQYAQEYMGEFVDALRQYFPDELITSCMNSERLSYLDSTGYYYLGVDVGREGGDQSTFEIIEKRGDHLYHVENITKTMLKLTETFNIIVELNRTWNFRKIYIDDGGIGTGVYDFLLDYQETKNKVVPLNNRARTTDKDGEYKKKILKHDLYANLKILMERNLIHLLKDDEIFQSFKSVQYEYDLTPKALTLVKIFGNFTHIVEGLTRASWCHREKSLKLWGTHSNDGHIK